MTQHFKHGKYEIKITIGANIVNGRILVSVSYYEVLEGKDLSATVDVWVELFHSRSEIGARARVAASQFLDRALSNGVRIIDFDTTHKVSRYRLTMRSAIIGRNAITLKAYSPKAAIPITTVGSITTTIIDC